MRFAHFFSSENSFNVKMKDKSKNYGQEVETEKPEKTVKTEG